MLKNCLPDFLLQFVQFLDPGELVFYLALFALNNPIQLLLLIFLRKIITCILLYAAFANVFVKDEFKFR